MISKENRSLSVGELSDILKACFQNPAFHGLKVYGEVYSLRRGKFSYLEIGDPGKNEVNSPLLKCAFRTIYGDSYGLSSIKVGDIVEITGDLSYYSHGSSVTLWGEEISIREEQAGANLLLKRKTLEKLERLGYLDEKRKRKIPALCQRVAIVTAYPSAAYEDILKTLHERFPLDTVLFPATVQGEGASRSLIHALEQAKKGKFDCLILGRGGGSKTDLSAFDDEKLALEIATYPCPVITCIGHTIDTSICDRVSDVSAITPTEGAMLINPSLAEVKEKIAGMEEELNANYLRLLDERQMSLDSFRQRLQDLSPLRRISLQKEKAKHLVKLLHDLYERRLYAEKNKQEERRRVLKERFRHLLSMKEKRFLFLQGSLLSLDPSLARKKGYAQVYCGTKLVKAAKELQRDTEITIHYLDGTKKAKVQ